jgi:alkylation response protein AidB-like acyl-CoA dehydrogenase
VLQVHGGSGYMRDTGAEKIVRDQNMLKLQIGGTRDAHLFVAAWMETLA